MKALIVDDSNVMRRIIINGLKELPNMEFLEAADGREAVETCNVENPGLVLMDWNMPNLPGLDAVKAIRSMGKTMPIIMVTTEAEKERVILAMQCGANDYLIKPFTPADLQAKVKSALSRFG
ncbi:MAG TPA: response regulator [Chroococcales cyanobacterium]